MSVYFRDILGQSAVKSRIIKSVQSGRLAHTLLYSSEDGGAALPMAIATARYLQCSDKKADDACGECLSCKQWDKMGHPDVHFSFPIAKQAKKVERSADVIEAFRESFQGQIYLDGTKWMQDSGAEKKSVILPKSEAEDLFHSMKYKSFQGGYRVGIIWQPELLNAEAANFLLKMLEEPKPNTQFILVSAKPNDLLATIISRCQIMNMAYDDLGDLSEFLEQKFDVENNLAQQIASASNGVVGKALRLLEQGGVDSHFETFRAWMRLCFAKNLSGISQWTEEMAGQSRDNVKSFLAYAQEVMHKCIWYNYRGEYIACINKEEQEFVAKFSAFMKGMKVAKAKQYFDDAVADISWNANAKIVFTDLSYKILVLLKK